MNGVPCPSGPSPSFTIKAAALSAEHSCYPSSKTSFQSRKNVMTKKDIYCLAFISIFPKQKATILGCSVWYRYLATLLPLSGTWVFPIPLLSVPMEPRASCLGSDKPHFYLQHTWRKCEGNRWRYQALCKAMARNIKGNLEIQKLHPYSTVYSLHWTARRQGLSLTPPPPLNPSGENQTSKQANKI